jgi:hypothetical protein
MKWLVEIVRGRQQSSLECFIEPTISVQLLETPNENIRLQIALNL